MVHRAGEQHSMSAAERTGEHAAFSENEKSCGEDDDTVLFWKKKP